MSLQLSLKSKVPLPKGQMKRSLSLQVKQAKAQHQRAAVTLLHREIAIEVEAPPVRIEEHTLIGIIRDLVITTGTTGTTVAIVADPVLEAEDIRIREIGIE